MQTKFDIKEDSAVIILQALVEKYGSSQTLRHLAEASRQRAVELEGYKIHTQFTAVAAELDKLSSRVLWDGVAKE